MDGKNKLSQSEMLSAIADAVRRRQAGEDPMLDPVTRRVLRENAPGPDLVIPKRDPQREVNQRFLKNIGIPKAPLPDMGGAEDISDDLLRQELMKMGDESIIRENELNPEEQQRRQIRLQMLHNASKTGRMGGQPKE